MKIESRIALLYDHTEFRKRKLSDVDSIMFHRNEEGEDAEHIARWHAEHPEASGSPLMPYTFVIGRAGIIEQAAPLNAITPHGRSWNKRSIAVCLVGDFRGRVQRPPSSFQIEAAKWLARRIQDYMRKPLLIVGHSASPGASKWGPAHDCPGKLFPLNEVVAAVRDAQNIVEAV